MSLYTRESLRQAECESIRRFVADAKLTGRVLDFGAGKQPYKDLVDGEYVPYEKDEVWPEGEFDAILMTQVIQYLPSPLDTLKDLRSRLRPSGLLAMTYPTHWEVCEPDDYWRFTQHGIMLLLMQAGYAHIAVNTRYLIEFEDFAFVVGGSVTAFRV
jgi:SAM-dependent methyltransferase